MSPAFATPTDEYEAQLAERREKAWPRVRRLIWWSIGLHFGGIAFLALVIGVLHLVYGEHGDPPDWVVKALYVGFPFILCGSVGASFLTAGAAAVFTLRNWGVLKRGQIVVGLAPWAVATVEAALILVGLVASL